MNVVWRGGWIGRARILSGLILFAFALTHFLNHAVGLISVEAMEAVQGWRIAVTRSLPGSALLAAALIVHTGMAIGWVATRRSFRMPARQAVQTLLGLAIPLLLLPHIVETRAAAEFLGVSNLYSYELIRLWSLPDGAAQILLLLIVWVHGCMGIHFWLHELGWWRQILPTATALATLVPAFAIAGFLDAGSAIAMLGDSPPALSALMSRLHMPTARGEELIGIWSRLAVLGFVALLAAAIILNVLTRLASLRRRVEIVFAEGPRITGYQGMTLLEMAESNRVPLVALCHGKGRCSTCRVVIERGRSTLPAAEAAEAETLAAVHAPENTRLACQIRPRAPLSVFRVYDIKHGRARAHASTGIERRMTILFLDMRGFTARTSGALPYDVVYLLNRFFDAVVPEVTERGGRVDKYLGDGFLAIFDLPGGPGPSCRAALEAVVAIDAALTRFNAAQKSAKAEPVTIGLGLHVGELVQGEIGAAGMSQITIIGDAVNTAARLEGMTKLLSAQALISRPVLEEAGVTLPDAAWQNLNLRGVHLDVQAIPLRSGADLLPFLASSTRKGPAQASQARLVTGDPHNAPRPSDPMR